MTPTLEQKFHIFDLDDTLINTRAAYYAAQEKAIESEFSHQDPQILQRYKKSIKWLCQRIGSGSVNLYFSAFLSCLNSYPKPFDSLLQSLVDAYYEHYWNGLTPLDGVLTYLSQLDSEQKIFGIVSNGKTESQYRKLKQTGLDKIFSDQLTFISEQFPLDHQKPSPTMIQKACQKAKMSLADTVYYGNVAGDIIAGNLAGVTTVFLGDDHLIAADVPEVAQPDFSVSHWEELL